jgi:competence protein ComEA
MENGGSELLRPAPPVTWRDRADAVRSWGSGRPWFVVVAAAVGIVGVVVGAVALLRPPAVAAPPAEVWLPQATAGAGDAGGGSGATSTTVAAAVVVHVAGAVVRPGLVRLDGGMRVADAVDAAGGPRSDADLDRLNLAAPLVDGQRVWVPVVGQVEPVAVTPGGPTVPGVGRGGGAAATGAVVDLNTATLADLESLPGVGPATAQAILDHRQRVGGFRSVDDLLDVRGIGPAKLEALRDRVRV